MCELVSVVIPIYNEKKYITDCIESLLKQTYPKEHMEIIFVDGNSQDETPLIIEQYAKEYGHIKLLHNPERIIPVSMNIGIREAKGQYLIRLDAHAEYPDDYIEKCVHYLNTTKADNVGGCAITKGRGFVGDTIAAMLSSKFGVGNSKFRTEQVSAYVDTVPFGAFRREVFDKNGLFDERLARSEDNEFNYRIRKNGGKIFLAKDITFTYYCRDSLKSLAKMAIDNGEWNIVAMKLCPGSMGVRHMIPLVFVLSILMLSVLSLLSKIFLFLLLLELGLYFSLSIVFAIKEKKEFLKTMLLIGLFPLFHITYGIGSIMGIYMVIRNI